MDEELKPLRDAIDEIDRKIVLLLNERARLAKKVGSVKSLTDAPVYRPEREAEVFRKAAAANAGPLSKAALTGIMREVISACRALELPLKVAYLGPEGTFSEQAMLQQFGSSVVGLPCVSIDEAFRAAESGSAQFVVVPVENSTEGAVNRTLDLLLSTPLRVVAEVSVLVQHHLLSQNGTLDGIKQILSHPQTFGQCVNWLNQRVPQLERVAAASNAQAAQQAAQQPDSAAIAGAQAAHRYGLKTVAANIQDGSKNTTRFLVLGAQTTGPTGHDKTSLILSVPNQAGAVYQMLQPLAKHGVSMTRFESRPAKMGAWEYYFYVDIEGHEADQNVATALTELRSACAFFKNLGSYPISEATEKAVMEGSQV